MSIMFIGRFIMLNVMGRLTLRAKVGCNTKQIHARIRLFIFTIILTSSQIVLAKNWYVRTYSMHTSGDNSGSSYENAWRGLANIRWGSTGVKAGDVLFVCGTHDEGYRSRSIDVKSSGFAGNRITIDGKCYGNNGKLEQGVILSAGSKITKGWQGPDANGVYSINYGGSTGLQMIEDRTKRLIKEKVEPNSSWKAGSFYNDGKGVIYYKPSSGLPSDHIIHTNNNYVIKIYDQNFITVKNLSVYNASSLFVLNNAKNIVIENNKIQWSNIGIAVYNKSDNLVIKNNEIMYCANGIYIISSKNENNSNRILVRSNRIHDINQYDYYQNVDSHAIGIQGGNSSIFEFNVIYSSGGSGITFYSFARQEQKNNLVRYNQVYNIEDLSGNRSRGRNERGIEYSNSNAYHNADDTIGNIVHHNIIAFVKQTGIRTKSQFSTLGPTWQFYNNLVYKAGISFEFSDFPDGDSNFILKNNLLVSPDIRHISHIYKKGEDLSHINIDHNAYFPRTKQFVYKNKFLTFSEWKNETMQDSNSNILNPFSNSEISKLIIESRNFIPSSNFLLINKGIYVGIKFDYYGSSISPFSKISIGPFQKSSSAAGDLNKNYGGSDY